MHGCTGTWKPATTERGKNMPGTTITKCLTAVLLVLATLPAFADTPATVRVDYYHTGNADSEVFSLHQVVIEPLPWPGHPGKNIDTVGRGHFMLQVEDPDSGDVLYSRGFSSIYQEWQHTAEAREMRRTFHESVRFPKPEKPVLLRILKRQADHGFESIWTVTIDTDDMLVVREHATPPAPVIDLYVNGPPAEKVDIVVLGDGYTAEESGKFENDARRLVDYMFEIEPFKSRAADFNVRAINPPAPRSGSNRPSNGTFRHSPSGTTFDAFRSERYILAFDNPGLRSLIQHVPYEFVFILANSETYGGGGIYKLYATVAVDSDWAEYVFVHEFGHHFAALADEYYTSDVAYEFSGELPEPWEPNATAMRDPEKLKWAHLVEEGTPLPTPWPKSQFEAYQNDYQSRRRQLRAENRPEAEMNELFREAYEFNLSLFARHPETNSLVGAFEGANYQAAGYYRPQMNCMMFTRHDVFCRVCREAIEEVIDLYSR
jgi:hypothetical protein